MPQIPAKHIEAAYQVGRDVYAGKLRPTDAINRLARDGLNEASATFFIYNLRAMLDGELYQRAMSVEATRFLLQWIHRDYGDDGLKSALKALRRHIPYFRQSSPSPMRGHVQLLSEFTQLLTTGGGASKSSTVGSSGPVGWIFQGNNNYFRVDDYVRDFDELWWSVNQKHFAPLIAVDQPAFIWRAKGSGSKPAGLIAACRITQVPRMAKEQPGALAYYESDPPTKPYLQVVMKVTRRFVEPERMLTREVVAQDVALRGLHIIRMPAQTTYSLTSIQCRRIFDLIGADAATTTRPTYHDFGQAPNDDPSELRTFAAKVRRGQAKFRENLIRLYDGKCAITGCTVESTLEGCHIWDHTTSGINHTENGLLLRADIHCLFDEGLITIEPQTLTVRVNAALSNTEYQRYHGQVLMPRSDGSAPSAEYLIKRAAVPALP